MTRKFIWARRPILNLGQMTRILTNLKYLYFIWALRPIIPHFLGLDSQLSGPYLHEWASMRKTKPITTFKTLTQVDGTNFFKVA